MLNTPIDSLAHLILMDLICKIIYFLDAGNAVSAKITTAGIGVVKSNPKDRKTLRNRK